jgi:hypothetical protein
MKKNISRVLLVVVTLGFLFTGFFKLSGAQMMVDNFIRWGYPIWFMYTVAVLEVLGVIGLYVRQARTWALIGLSVLMVGAIGTHLLNGEAFAVAPSTILLVSLLTLLFLDRKMAATPVNG